MEKLLWYLENREKCEVEPSESLHIWSILEESG